ncbi:branched-chain amino acid transport system II carrier protein [Jeotgalibaca caeni]|uniref:branched-chain amino acid transport system II carrier protein n=1 Tax=Jeotgalibaca caeni TaxID=3028623 RepID=UPI00237EE653|nr:branched-chain amino acid transport system II carrier protein [Jeotgalibaca caeni]MDE1549905.1 branched-chain amino acid transport system II carrier protein [Jeotgalibaca caeni]
MKRKDILIVGFMLFAMFFGAGNLIFPVALGFMSGEHFWPAIFGFILTGVGLPLISVIVGSISENGYRDLLKKIHPLYSVVFLMVIYLTIGPFFAIPRTATTAYEMGIVPFLNHSTDLSLFLFTIGFFLIVLLVVLSPNRLADSIGKYLTPTLLITIIILIVRAVIMYGSNEPQVADGLYQKSEPFMTGFTEGYLTMDAIASIAFSIIVLNAIRELGVTDKKALWSGTVKSSFLAVVLLGVIYTGLGWVGNRMSVPDAIPVNQNLGTFLLQLISKEAFGTFGIAMLGVIVFLSCLTTAIGLIAAVSEYFHGLIPAISYKMFAILFTVFSGLIANQGLDQVIETSVPVLGIIYPIAISTVLLIVVSLMIPSSRFSLQFPLIIVALESGLSLIHKQGWMKMDWLEQLPLYHIQFEWVLLLVAGYIIGQVISLLKPSPVLKFGAHNQ